MCELKNPGDKEQRFIGPPVPLGRMVTTPAVLEAVPFVEIVAAMERHKRHDWGTICKADWEKNDQALKNGERILSAYRAQNGTKFWIITECDRSCTTVLLPSEY